MIKDAEKKGVLKKDTVIIEPTSGNTGIALSFVCASLGYKLILTMPETMSVERRIVMKALGAELVLTDGKLGMRGAIAKSEELHNSIENSIILNQFSNPANPQIHSLTTAKEILTDTKGDVAVFVCGVGTGGTITGVGEVLKKKIKNIKIVAVEPCESPILSGGVAGPHKIQGIGAGFVPSILNTKVYDEVKTVSYEDACYAARLFAKVEGVLVGVSSGAALFVGLELAKLHEYKDKNIVVILPDTGERYLSTPLFNLE
jgi:cysteine synthase A